MDNLKGSTLALTHPYLFRTTWTEFWQGADQQAAIEAIAKARAGEVCIFQGYRPTLRGEPMWWDSKVSPILGADGQVERLLCISRDITDRKQTEAALRQSEEHYRMLFESTDEGFCTIEVLFDVDGKPFDHRILQANPAFERQVGLSNPAGKTASELVPGLEQYWNDLYAQVIHTGESIRTEVRSDALDRWFDVLVSRVGDAAVRQVAIVFTDISDRKRTELEIQKFVSLADNSGEFIGMCDMNFVPFYVNSAGRQLVGLDDVQQYIETSVRDFFFPEDQDFIINEFFPRVLQEGRAEVEIRFRHFKTGAALWMIYNVFYIRGENNQPLGLATVSRNITDRKQAEAARRESESRLRFMLDASQIGEWDLNLTTEPYTAHRSLRHDQIFGYESLLPEWSYEIFLAHVHPDDRAAVDEKFQETLSASTNWNFECRVIHPDQSIHWIWVRSSVYCDSSGTPTRLLGMVVDITEAKRDEVVRKQTEEALRESENRLRLALESAELGTWDFNPKSD